MILKNLFKILKANLILNVKILWFIVVDKLVNVYSEIFLEKKFSLKKWFYTINHKKLGLLYFYYVLVSAIVGSYFATCIRLEMAYPGSPFFNGDSLKYLQVITAHALIMIFFVVVPIFFGGFANYFLPYHVGSKDVAYPRLNNMGFWIQPCGFLLIAKMGSMRLEYWTAEMKTSFFSSMTKVDHFLQQYRYDEFLNYIKKSIMSYDYTKLSKTIKDALEERGIKKSDYTFTEYNEVRDQVILELNLPKRSKYDLTIFDEKSYSYKLIFWKDIHDSANSLWFLTKNSESLKRQKRFLIK